MKNFLAIIIVIFLNSTFFCYSQIEEVELSPLKVVQIITPGRYYHDDGADLVKYPKYEIRDTTGLVVMVVPESINRHHTIKLLPGKYVLELQKPGKKKVYEIIINQENYQLFQVSKLSKTSNQ